MLRNYLKIAFRNLSKRKVYSLINILGLAIGMSVCLLIVLFIKNELSYDREQAQGERIFRMVVDRKYPGRSTSYSFIPQSYAQAVKLECPEVEEAVRVFNNGNASLQLRYEDKKFEEKDAFFVDSNFFRVFTGKFLVGDLNTALSSPNSTVLTETTAKRYFGSVNNALGKLLITEGEGAPPLKVTGVCADWEENSHFLFDILITTAGFPPFAQENYIGFSAHTYLLLNNAKAKQSVEQKFPAIIQKYAAGNIQRSFAMSLAQFQSAGNGYRYYLQPLPEIHLTSQLEGEIRPNGSMKSIYIFSVVAVFILILACINFINLATARSIERAREVGIRKTFGSEKKALILQFLTESTMLSFFSMLLSCGIVYLLLPLFNRVSGKELLLSELFTLPNIAILASFTLLTGMVAGIYPAFILSSFNPIVVLKGKFRSSNYGLALRNGLVIFQFAISVILIICTIIVNSQMQFMTSERLGFDKEHTIIVERTDLLRENTRAFKNEVMKLPGVATISGASSFPGINNYFGVTWQVKGSNAPMTGRGIFTDDQHAATLGLELSQGRYFSNTIASDSLAIVLNERAVKELDLKNPIGAQLVSFDDNMNGDDGNQYAYTVVGVVKDFHYQSLHNPITPLVFNSSSRFNDVLFLTAVKIKSADFNSTISALEEKWKSFVKDRPFQYSYLDQTIEEQYLVESTTQNIFTFFSSLAIFIACIGLLGLAAYATQQRMHEISIRKVLGASAGNIVMMLSANFLKLIIIATLVAFPIAWWAMYNWLESFAYRIDISWQAFVIAGLAAIFVALLTISLQAIRAAYSNPVRTLKSAD